MKCASAPDHVSLCNHLNQPPHLLLACTSTSLHTMLTYVIRLLDVGGIAIYIYAKVVLTVDEVWFYLETRCLKGLSACLELQQSDVVDGKAGRNGHTILYVECHTLAVFRASIRGGVDGHSDLQSSSTATALS